ncbi:MAG: hypothetical protein D6805_06090 [Planctomycetota bacterium]|nr:MAG: hypothetical protein D6805_06090 [Planctomycetota bacterium]
MNSLPITETTLQNVRILKRTNHWDIYRLDNRLLFVAMDKITYQQQSYPIPYKGIAIAKILALWYQHLQSFLKTHYLTSDIEKIPTDLGDARHILKDRTLLVKKASVIPIDFWVCRYLPPTLTQSYTKLPYLRKTKLPRGLTPQERLEEPVIFARNASSHQEYSTPYLGLSQMSEVVGDKITWEIQQKSLSAFECLEQLSQNKGFILAQMRFRWGLLDGDILLIGEPLSKGDCLFWKLQPNQSTPNHQELELSYEREPFQRFCRQLQKNNHPPPPQLPPKLVEEIAQRYLLFCQKWTGFHPRKEKK